MSDLPRLLAGRPPGTPAATDPSRMPATGEPP